MNRLPATAHRLTTGLIGLLLVVVGAAAICSKFDVAPVAGWINRIDTDRIGRFTDGGWWTAVLAGIVVVTLLWAIPLIVSTVRPSATDDVELAGSDETGSMSVAPKLIASAVADELTGDPMFTSVSARALNDRARSIIRVEVTAKPERTYPEIAEKVSVAADQIRDALAGSDVYVQAFIHLERRKR